MLTLEAAFEHFDHQLRSAHHGAFKAEVLQDYSAIDDGPSFRAWKAGDERLAQKLIKNDVAEWVDFTRELTISISRVHVVEFPLTTYMNWQINCSYKCGILPAGKETIALVPSTKLRQSLPAGDFWIFDDSSVLEFAYDHESGLCVGAYVYEQPDRVERYRSLRTELLTAAEDLPGIDPVDGDQ